MIGSIVVALVTVSLLLTGVYLGNVQNRTGELAEEDAYDEGFFGSLDSLVGGLQESAERGEETKADRYQEYLRVRQASEEATNRFQEGAFTTNLTPRIVAPTTQITPVKPEDGTLDQEQQDESQESNEEESTQSNSNEDDPLLDFDDFGDLDDFDF